MQIYSEVQKHLHAFKAVAVCCLMHSCIPFFVHRINDVEFWVLIEILVEK